MRLALKGASGRLARPVSLATRVRSSQAGPAPVAQLQVGQLAADGVGREGGDPHAVDVLKAELGAGVGSFLADDHAHALGPAGQVEQVGELDPRPVADLAMGVVGGGPDVLGDSLERVRGVLREREPDGVGQAATGEPVDHLVRGPCPVDPHQHRLARPACGQLTQGSADHGDVVGGGVRPGVPGAQRDRQGFSGPGRGRGRGRRTRTTDGTRSQVSAR